MNDYMSTFENYKDVKEIADLVDEIKELQRYYNAQQYDQMQNHIQKLTYKYIMETITWNSVNQAMPLTVQQAYINAESFLRLKGFSVLIDKDTKVQNQLSSSEIDFIQSTFKPIQQS